MSQVSGRRYVKYLARYLELKAQNTNSWNEGPRHFEGPFDSSLKKNTAFIKRCRVNLNEANLDILLNEIRTVSLEKYIDEIIPALAEGLTRCKTSSDFMTGIEVASLLHQRFGAAAFTAPLIVLFLEGIQFPNQGQLDSLDALDKSNAVNETISRHKIIVRVTLEFWLVGLFRSVADLTSVGMSRKSIPQFMSRGNNGIILPPPLAALYETLQKDDLSSFPAIEIVESILKNFGGLLLVDSLNPTANDEDLVYTTTKEQFMHVFESYAKRIEERLLALARTVRYTNKRNEQAFLNRGKVDEVRAKQLEDLRSKLDDLNTRYQSLCGLIGRKISLFDVDDTEEHQMKISIWANNQESIWEDEEERLFYEDVPRFNVNGEEQSEADSLEAANADLSSTEMDLERLAAEAEAREASMKAKEEAMLEQLEAAANDELDDVDVEVPDQGEGDKRNPEAQPNVSTTPAGKLKEPKAPEEAATEKQDPDEKTDSTGQRISELVLLLVNRPSREVTDRVATEFMKYNKKDSRNFLVKQLTDIHPSNIAAVSHIARFLAIMATGAPDVTERVIEDHMKYFDYLQKKRAIPAMNSRRRFNMRLLSELAKFGLLTNYFVFHVFKALLANLDKYNSEFLTLFIENCGRYLLYKPKYALVADKSIDILKRKLKSGKLEQEGKFMLEGALLYVEPKKTKIKGKERPIMEQFIRRMIQYELSSITAPTILQLLLKVDILNDPIAENALFKTFSKVWKVNVTVVPLMAWLLEGIKKFYPKLALVIIDNNLENIRRGLETARFQTNQQRVTEVLYLAELFKVNLVDEKVIWDTLFMFTSLGHVNGRPEPGRSVILDPINDFFRIRLICVLLQTIAIDNKFSNKESEQKLLSFLRIFDYYIFTKDKLSMDINFMVQETFGKVCPSFVRARNIIEASANLLRPASQAAVNGQRQSTRSTVLVSDSSDMFTRRQDAVLPKPSNSEALTPEEKRIKSEADKKRQAILNKARQERERREADEEFERQFTQLMVDRTPIHLSATARANASSRDKAKPMPRTVFDRAKGTMSFAGPEAKDESTNNFRAANAAVKVFDAPIPRTASTESSESGKMKFRLLTKKPGQQHSLEIPEDTSFAIQTRAENAKLLEEQEKLTNFVIGYVKRSASSAGDEEKIATVVQPTLVPTSYRKNGKNASPRVVKSDPMEYFADDE